MNTILLKYNNAILFKTTMGLIYLKIMYYTITNFNIEFMHMVLTRNRCEM